MTTTINTNTIPAVSTAIATVITATLIQEDKMESFSRQSILAFVSLPDGTTAIDESLTICNLRSWIAGNGDLAVAEHNERQSVAKETKIKREAKAIAAAEADLPLAELAAAAKTVWNNPELVCLARPKLAARLTEMVKATTSLTSTEDLIDLSRRIEKWIDINTTSSKDPITTLFKSIPGARGGTILATEVGRFVPVKKG
jgi:hypothetical protein